MVIGLITLPDGNSAADRLIGLARSSQAARKSFASSYTVSAVNRRFALAVDVTAGGSRPRVEVADTAAAKLVILGDAPSLPSPDILARAVLPEAPLEWDLPGRWISALVPKEPSAPIHWASDALGAQWLYFTAVDSAILFSDDYAAAAAFAPRQTTVDPFALRRALVLGYNLGDETLHPSIKLAPPGCVFEPLNGGFRILRRHGVDYTDKLASASPQAKVDAVDEAFRHSAKAWRAVLPPRTGISLSAGLDSRTAFGYLRRAGVAMSCFTFGNPESSEVRGAAEVAARVGARTEVFPVPPASWEDWETGIQKLGVAGPVQTVGWSRNWLEHLAGHVDALVHGYLGDAVSGKHLSSSTKTPTDWCDYWTRWSVGSEWHTWPGLKEEWRRTMLKDLHADVRDAADQPQVAFPHQRALHVDLYCRQRRWAASQANEIASRMLPVCFFYHPSVFRVWASLPFEDLRDQNLYRASNRRNLSELFPPQPSPVGRFARRVGRKLGRMFRAQDSRPRVVDRSRLLAAMQRAAIDRILSVRALIEQVVDVPYVVEVLKTLEKRSPTEAESLALIRVVNVAHLVALAHERQPSSATSGSRSAGAERPRIGAG